MTDISLEVVRAVIVACIALLLYSTGKNKAIRQQEGWNCIVLGFVLILLGSLVDITDNFPNLDKYIFIGDTQYQAFIEKVIGYLAGFLLLALGFWKWLPIVINLKKTEQALQKANESLDGKVKERTSQLEEEIVERKKAQEQREHVQMIMRHDLKTPLNGILGYSQLLQKEALTEKQLNHISFIEMSGKRMLQMIESSLDIFKIEQGTFEFTPSPVKLFSVLHHILEDLNRESGKNNNPIEIYLNGSPLGSQPTPIASGEEILCYAMFSNIIKNAVEAEKNIPDPKVQLFISTSETQCEVAVKNSNTVPENVRDTFFNKFSTDGKSRGCGLGAYSSKLLAHAQGGDIRMETSKETGTVITITLPLWSEHTALKNEEIDT